jgi:hypothetical protein
MKLEISLSPTGGLRLYLPTGRHLDVETTNEKVQCDCCGEAFRTAVEPASLKAIKRILRDAEAYKPGQEQPGYIGAFPTQAVLDIWAKEFKKKHAEEDAAARKAALRQKYDLNLDEVDISL